MKYDIIVQNCQSYGSPSVWREWIEIPNVYTIPNYQQSPSVWREWIEILSLISVSAPSNVSLRVEGVD